MRLRRSAAIPKRIIRLPKSAGMPKSKVMSIYRAEVNRLHNKQSAVISQRNVTIGTDDRWANGLVINRDPAWVQVADADYLWSSRDPNGAFAVVSRRFTLSSRRSILSGSMFLSVDNYAVVIINGRIVVYDAPQNTPAFFNPGRTFNIRSFLRRGFNTIVIVAFNFGAPRSPSNPAGVAARLNIRLSTLQ
jgi:hypothetical protein